MISLLSEVSHWTSLSDELYSKDTHFILEFIQNADDNSYVDGVCPTLQIKMNTRERTIEISCNERGFNESNVRAICSVGKSTKARQQGYIGKFSRWMRMIALEDCR